MTSLSGLFLMKLKFMCQRSYTFFILNHYWREGEMNDNNKAFLHEFKEG